MQAPTIEEWSMIHNDSLHPGSRESCPHCQEMIRIYGPMPPIAELERAAETYPPRAKQKKAMIPERLRWAVFERDDFRCQHCGDRQFLTIDHIHPEALGGLTEASNLQTLCRSCNARKGVKILDSRD